ncbi:MAG: hypothetical protein KDA24_28590 [Deltaproteobacteria bacterium]|nr:hypothetical protein [Deltaproteobacteria bacterium]
MRSLTLARFAPLLAALLIASPAAFAQDEAGGTVVPSEMETATPAAAEPGVIPTDPSTPPPAGDLSIERIGANDEEDVKVTGQSTTTVWAGGRTVDIDATAPDVFAAGETVSMGGVVLDNLVGAGRVVTVDGPVHGDAFLFGETLTVNANIGGDLYAAGETLRIPADVSVGGNVYFGGAEFALQGDIGGDLKAGGANFTIDGSVGGDVNLETATLNVGADAVIGGDLAYSAPSEGSISGDASIQSVDWTQKASDMDSSDEDEASGFGGGASVWVFFLLSSLLVGGVLFALFPRAITQPAAVLEEEAPVALGIGFAVLLGVPVLAIFLALFVLPIPLSLLAMAIYIPTTFLARFVAAYALGRLALERLGRPAGPLWALFAGLVALRILYAIPLLGSLVMLVATVLGLGALFLAARRAADAKTA